MVNIEEVRKGIRKFLEEETQSQFNDSDNLIEKGVLDSFLMIKLIGYLEKNLGTKIDMGKLTPYNFNSVLTISQFIASG